MTQDQTQEDFFTPSQFQTLEKMAAPGPLPVQFPYNLKATPYLHVRADLSCDELLYYRSLQFKVRSRKSSRKLSTKESYVCLHDSESQLDLEN